jgi:hypothetical protein
VAKKAANETKDHNKEYIHTFFPYVVESTGSLLEPHTSSMQHATQPQAHSPSEFFHFATHVHETSFAAKKAAKVTEDHDKEHIHSLFPYVVRSISSPPEPHTDSVQGAALPQVHYTETGLVAKKAAKEMKDHNKEYIYTFFPYVVESTGSLLEPYTSSVQYAALPQVHYFTPYQAHSPTEFLRRVKHAHETGCLAVKKTGLEKIDHDKEYSHTIFPYVVKIIGSFLGPYASSAQHAIS